MKKNSLNKKKSINFIFGLISIFLIYKIAYRTTGIDYDAYVRIYNAIQVGGVTFLKSRIEPLFVIFFLISPTRIIAFGLIGAISVFFKLKSILTYSYYPILSLFLYYILFFYIDDMGRVRAGIASAIMIYAIKYLGKKRYLLFLLIAFSFHKSMLLYIIIYILYKVKLTKKKMVYIFIISLVFSLIDFSKIIYFMSLLPHIGSTASLYLFSTKRIGFSPIMIVKVFYLCLFFLNYEKLRYYKYFNELFLIYLIGNSIYFCFNSVIIIVTRGSEIFTCIEFILLPYLLKITNVKIYKIFILFCIISYFLYIRFKYTL